MNRSDVVHALLWLRHDFDIDPTDIAPDAFSNESELPDEPRELTESRAWFPATRRNVMMIAGLWEAGEFDLSMPELESARADPPCYPCYAATAGGDVETLSPPTGDDYADAVSEACACCNFPQCPPNCNDGNPCTNDYCQVSCGVAWCAHDSRNCNDGEKCTIDSCNPTTGNCQHSLRVCHDGNNCTSDACNPATGSCVYTPRCTPGKCCPAANYAHFCCASDEVCCNDPNFDNHCCPNGQTCCGDDCCPNGWDCLDGLCCEGQWCGQTCCEPDDTCCGDDCCPPETPQCCNSELGVCCGEDGLCCEQECCDADATCCGGFCCDADQHCCPDGVTCCEDGQECCHEQCCPVDFHCCGDPGVCCLPGDTCCGGLCCDGPCCEATGECCPSTDQSCCNDECCEGPCCDDTCCPGGPLCCGDGCCAGEQTCCGETTCCDPQYCCDNDECCAEECVGCLDNGALSGGSIDVQPETICLGDTITFTASDVQDSGGVMRVFCSAKTPIAPVAPTYTWTLTIPPGYPSPLPPLTGSGSVASVVALAAGTYSCTFTASAERECPPEDLQIGPVTKDTCQSTTVAGGQGPTCGITLALKSITFLDDHQMYENDDPGNWGAGEPLLPPDWEDVNSPDNAICYSRGLRLRMEVRVEIKSSGVETPTLRVQGPDGIEATVGVTSQCGTAQRTATMITTTLPNYVTRYEPMSLNWSFQRQGENTWTAIGSTAHHLFVSYGTPTYDDPVTGGPTQWRMRNLCGAALDADTALEVVDGISPSGGIGIHRWLAGNPPNEPPPPEDITPLERELHEVRDWRLMSGSPYWGECDEQANMMNRAVTLIGGAEGTVRLINASTDANPLGPRETTTAGALGITEDLDGDGTMGEESLELIFDFEPPTGFWNWFEASLETTSGFYAVWPNYKAQSACELLLTLLTEEPGGEGATQHWIFIRPNGTLYVYPATIAGPISCP